MKVNIIKEVRKTYLKAWSEFNPNRKMYSIYSGQDKDPNDVPYRPKNATPHGWKIGEGKKLKEAWQNAFETLKD